MDKQIKSTFSMKRVLGLLLALMIITAIYLGYLVAFQRFIPDWQTRGLVGDSFGGLNTLFSGLALIGVIYALLLQQKQLKLQKIENNTNTSLTKRQIDEMQRTFQLQYQPVVLFVPEHLSISKPSLFTSPSEDGYHALSRYFFHFEVTNLTDTPAINLLVSGNLFAEAEQKECLSCAGCHFNVLAKGMKEKENFMFAPQKPFITLFDALSDQHAKRIPTVEIEILYKNIMGACFYAKQAFYIFFDKEKEETFSKWHSSIASFTATFKKELQNLQKLRKEPTLRQKAFRKLEETFEERTEGDEEIKLKIVPIPGAYLASSVDENKYEELCKNFGLPRVTFAHTECLHEEEKE